MQIFDAFRGTKDYSRFKSDPNEQYKQNNLVNLQYSLIDFCGTSFLNSAYQSKIRIFDSPRAYHKALSEHSSHTKILLAMNPRLKDGTQLVCMVCLNCFEILGLTHDTAVHQPVDFKEMNDLIFKSFRVYMDWSQMKSEVRTKAFDYKALVNKLAEMFIPEDD